ncbi:threonine/serine exporter family protein [Murimonas intestini]|uniref:threonine/serine exporter family protein n=1 Tax=Murimonas intestini TaxID=1337051 RepID=UPI0011DD4F88|nr:threonine/serine exporter family protein [Murimonas intestini]
MISNPVFQVIAAFFAIAGFSIVIEVPKKFLVYSGFVGAVGWAVYLLFLDKYGIMVATFFGGMAIALISHIFARIFKAPVTIFLIPGILVIVPGAGMYRTVYQIFLGEQGLAADYLLQTIQMAGMIALAIFAMDSVFSILQNKKWKSRRRLPYFWIK